MAVDRSVFDKWINDMGSNFFSGRLVSARQADFLYSEIKYWSQAEFLETARRILRNEIYFPKLKTWMETRAKIREERPKNELREKQPCDWCDGYGWWFQTVLADGHEYSTAYRGRCSHSSGFSKEIAMAPAGQKFSYPQKKKGAFRWTLTPSEPTNENEVPF